MHDMRTRSRRSRLLVVLATVLLACGDYGSLGDHASETGTGGGSETQGTESDGTGSDDSSDLVFFEGSGCKEGVPGEVYAGLECIAWDTTDPEVTKIELFNFEDGCEIEWHGEASVEPDGTLELRLLNPMCEGGWGCGNCLYDSRFGVANVPQNDELALRLLVGIRICDDEVPEEPPALPDPIEVSLPQGSEPIGAVCRYANWHRVGELEICGTVLMPCRTECDDDPVEPPCDEGLECAGGEVVDEGVCHPTCEVDEDCPWGGVLSCQDGLCRPASPW